MFTHAQSTGEQLPVTAVDPVEHALPTATLDHFGLRFRLLEP